MYKSRSVLECVTKHRALQKDKINAGCSEIICDYDRKITMRYIRNGLKDEPDWAPFRSAFKMSNKVKYPKYIEELEDWMVDDEC